MKAFHIFESFPPSFGATILVALFFFKMKKAAKMFH